MQDNTPLRPSEAARAEAPATSSWDRPSFEVIALDCEITAYAPEGDFPLL